MVHIERNTPKALANFSPGLERQRQPWDFMHESAFNPKGFAPNERLQRSANSFVW